MSGSLPNYHRLKHFGDFYRIAKKSLLEWLADFGRGQRIRNLRALNIPVGF